MKNKIQLTEMTVGHLSAKLFTGWVEPSDPHHIFRSNLHTASIHRSGVWALPHQPCSAGEHEADLRISR